MKKVLFLSLAASAVMASCSNEVLDSVVPQEPQAISFENPFLDKGTRANDMTVGTTFKKFYVYGQKGIAPTEVFNGTEITEYNGSWTSKTVQYWTNDTYNFIGYTNGNERLSEVEVSYAPTKLTVSNYVNTGDKDLVVSNAPTITVADHTSYKTPVELTFGHKLAKVYFTFTTDAVAGQTLTISKITLKGVNSKGDYTTAPEAWSNLGKEMPAKDYSYDGEVIVTPSTASGKTASASSVEKYMIPQTVGEFTVSFHAELTDGQNTDKGDFTVTLPKSVSNWAINNVYNYTAKITRDHLTLGNPIIFTPTVSSWTDTTNGGNTTNPEEVQVP